MTESIAPEERGSYQPLLYSSWIAHRAFTGHAREGESSCAQHCEKISIFLSAEQSD